MDSEKTIVIDSEWFEGAAELINSSAQTSEEGMRFIKRAIDAGKIALYRVILGDELLGIITARVDMTYDGFSEFVVLNVAEVKRTDIPYIVRINPLLNHLARANGCRRVLVHSERPGMDRRYENVGGFRLLEKIYVREV